MTTLDGAAAPPANVLPASRPRVSAIFEARGIGTRSPGEIDWVHEKFARRARTLFYARLAFLILGLGLIATPSLAQQFGIRSNVGFLVYFGMLGYTIANYVVLDHRVAGRWATFVTLCLDLLVLVYLIAASGGVHSPLMAAQLLFTTLFAILFPKPLAIVPPLLTLPVMVRIDQVVQTREFGHIDLFILLFYTALNFVIVYVLVYLNGREDQSHREILELQRDLRDLAVVEERNRLAREIHDGLGGALSSLIIQAEYLESLTKDDRLIQEIQDLKGAAEESIDELRRSLRMMKEDFDMVPAVEDYCRVFGERRHQRVIFETLGTPRRLGNEEQLAMFRILQEALNNAANHAAPSLISVTLSFEGEQLMLAVKDDGKGFEPGHTPAGHYGLLNMKDRAGKIGANVLVESALGNGTHVVLTIPLAKIGEA
jgi:two-component system, NarL family, sensor histidine kinase DegS